MINMRLENVRLIRYDDNSYRAEGNVYGSENFKNGTFIMTTFLEKIDFDKKVITSEEAKYKFDKIKAVQSNEEVFYSEFSG